MTEQGTETLKTKKKKEYVERFNDGRPDIIHNHPYKPHAGKRPRPPGPLKRLINRIDWRAKAPEYKGNDNRLALPVTHIRYVQTETPICKTFFECSSFMRDTQWDEMKRGHLDINYNFMVSAEGAVYEARGWINNPETPEEYAHLKGKILDIAFIGDFNEKKLPRNMLKAAEDLIDWGVWHYKIACCHEIIPMVKRIKSETASEPPDDDDDDELV